MTGIFKYKIPFQLLFEQQHSDYLFPFEHLELLAVLILLTEIELTYLKYTFKNFSHCLKKHQTIVESLIEVFSKPALLVEAISLM